MMKKKLARRSLKKPARKLKRKPARRALLKIGAKAKTARVKHKLRRRVIRKKSR